MFKIYILLLKQNNTNIGLKMCKATAFSRTSPTLKCPQEGGVCPRALFSDQQCWLRERLWAVLL